MYLKINDNQYAVTRRIVSADTVRYLGVTPAPVEISGMIDMCTDDGFRLSRDNADDYARRFMDGTALTMTNEPEPPEPEPPTDDELAEQARYKRDRLLAESDWTQVLDAPIDPETRDAYRVYRQALRDIPEQEGFPRSIVWPELPAVTKAAPDPVDTAFDTMIGGEPNA